MRTALSATTKGVGAIIARARELLGEDGFRKVVDHSLLGMVADIRSDLAEMGVTFDRWYSERSLSTSGAIDEALKRLEANGHTYRKDGALWFRASEFGDDEDRVVERENGVRTYFASDIAYHLNKFERGFDKVIDVWGADHHGYIPRVKGALSASGADVEVISTFQPPLSGGSFLARRATSVCQSIDCMSTFMPAFSISALAIGAMLASA